VDRIESEFEPVRVMEEHVRVMTKTPTIKIGESSHFFGNWDVYKNCNLFDFFNDIKILIGSPFLEREGLIFLERERTL
jgi:hypothetical protein